jgi:hypothetical protein
MNPASMLPIGIPIIATAVMTVLMLAAVASAEGAEHQMQANP